MKLITETIEEVKLITEEKNGVKSLFIQGPFLVAETKNKNGRMYKTDTLAKGEIGVILAPTGVGKTSLTTKFANHAFNMGFNVLQIFFEDNPKIIQRKHFTLWTGIAPDLLGEHKEEVMKKVTEVQDKMKNRLILKKLPSDTLTMGQIKINNI